MNLLLEVTSHIAGRNAKVRVYPDRVEWELPPHAKSIAARLGKTHGDVEMIPMRGITTVAHKRNMIGNDVVDIVVTSGNVMNVRCSTPEAERLCALILDGINGRLED